MMQCIMVTMTSTYISIGKYIIIMNLCRRPLLRSLSEIRDLSVTNQIAPFVTSIFLFFSGTKMEQNNYQRSLIEFLCPAE